ncbi:DUF6527 family protein [Mesorhizobium sp.]|nr:DUF6527 family protein [Mesorhizobium sp.]
MHPSVWRTKGCLSHFWLNDGRCRSCGLRLPAWWYGKR